MDIREARGPPNTTLTPLILPAQWSTSLFAGRLLKQCIGRFRTPLNRLPWTCLIVFRDMDSTTWSRKQAVNNFNIHIAVRTTRVVRTQMGMVATPLVRVVIKGMPTKVLTVPLVSVLRVSTVGVPLAMVKARWPTTGVTTQLFIRLVMASISTYSSISSRCFPQPFIQRSTCFMA